MGQSACRLVVSCVLSVIFPVSLFAADTNSAMLYTNGSAWVNGTHVPRPSSAIFAGDILQTRSDSEANIDFSGSSIAVMADSLVKFEGTSLNLEHGGLTVSTSKGISTTAGDVKVSPAKSAWTEFKVVDVDGTVRISARKGDLTINDGKTTTTLAEGQETSRDENSDSQDGNGKKKKRDSGVAAAPGAQGGILNSTTAIAVGGAVAAGLTAWVLVQSDNPASPSAP